MVFMAVVLEAANITYFKVALERDLSMDLVEFYHEVERYLHQEDGEAELAKINVVDGGPFGARSSKDRGKRKSTMALDDQSIRGGNRSSLTPS